MVLAVEIHLEKKLKCLIFLVTLLEDFTLM